MPRPLVIGTVILFLSSVCLPVKHAEALVSCPASEIEQRYKNIVRRHMESLRASGREIKDCFKSGEVEKDGVLKANESVSVLMLRPTLYGPGVNATSITSLVEHYEFVFGVLGKQFGVTDVNVTVSDQTQFHEHEAAIGGSAGTCLAPQVVNQCPFSPSNFYTVSLNHNLKFTDKAKCWKVQSRRGRVKVALIVEELLDSLGFQEVHLMDYIATNVYMRTPLLNYLSLIKDPLKDLEATAIFEIFGACAVPFSIEKQTLLRLALPEVLEREVNIYFTMVEVLSTNHGNGAEDSVVLKLTFGIYVDQFEKSVPEALHEATTSREGEVPPLLEYLSNAGLPVFKNSGQQCQLCGPHWQHCWFFASTPAD
eukprot:jgi/Botrbrau1/15300/Bobra.0096s0003.1